MCHRWLLAYFCEFCFVSFVAAVCWGVLGWVFLGNDFKKAEILPERIRKWNMIVVNCSSVILIELF